MYVLYLPAFNFNASTVDCGVVFKWQNGLLFYIKTNVGALGTVSPAALIYRPSALFHDIQSVRLVYSFWV